MSENRFHKTLQTLSQKSANTRAHFAKTQSGVSLMISVLLITLIVTFSLGVTNLVVNSTRQANDSLKAKQANYAAETAVEQALLASKSLQIGQNTQSENYTIKAQGSIYNGGKVHNGSGDVYISPSPYTGSAPWSGEGALPTGGCDPAKPPTLDQNKTFTHTDPSGQEISPKPYEIDHPCNWNKLALGEQATIPLFGYAIDSTGEQIPGVDDNPPEPVNMKDFILKIRTPCANGEEFCAASGRAMLDCRNNADKTAEAKLGDLECTSPVPITNPRKGDVIVLWRIEADKDGETITMLPNDTVPNQAGYELSTDTQINEGKINRKIAVEKDFNVLDATINNTQGKIDVLKPYIKTQFLSNSSHKFPMLKISAIGDIYGCIDNNCQKNSKDNRKRLPYLEYQVVFSSNSNQQPPANINKMITAQGQAGSFVRTIQVKVPQGTTTPEYVIQQ